MTSQWKKYMFKINEFYGDSEESTSVKKADIHAYFHQHKPVKSNKKFTIHRQALHLCFDLRKSEEVLMKEMSQTTRWKIRRAKRDKVRVTYIECPKLNDIKVFAQFYNAFAKAKGIEDCKFEKLVGLMKNNILVITFACNEDGRMLASSATIANKGTAIGLYAASGRFGNKDISGQFISRANRYLHWCEMIYFKRLGYHTFNMMGLTVDKSNTDHQKINDYKKSFGGEERTIYQSFIPQNMLGEFLMWMLKFLWRKNPEIIRNDHLLTTGYSEGEQGRP